MRVGLIIYGNLERNSGGYLYDRMLIDFLQDMGDDVSVLSLPCRGYFSSIQDNFSSSFYHRLLKADLDILLQDELNHPSLFLLNRRLRKRVKYQLVTIIHHLSYAAETNFLKKYVNHLLEKRYLSTVDDFIFNSQTNRSFVESFMGRKLSGIVAYPGRDHIHPSITPQDVYSRIQKSCSIRLLFLGNFVPHKGLHTLIMSLSQIDDLNWNLTVIGDPTFSPPYTESVYRLIDKLDLGSKIDILGFIPRSTLNGHLAESHILVVPSLYEGFGIAYLEGLGFGLPVIATTGGAAKEIITHGREGYLIPSRDPASLSRYLSLLIRDHDLLYRISINCLRRYRDFPPWSESVGKIRDFLSSLVRK